MPPRRSIAACVVLCLSLSMAWGGEFRYPEGQHGRGELRYINGLPVLSVAGTPEQIGEQVAALTARSVGPLLDYPKSYLRRQGRETLWPGLVSVGRSMLANFPEAYRRELDAAVKQSGIERDLLIVGNTMFDMKKIGGCSTLIVEPARSTTGGPLFGRNLDFPTLGILEKYNLITVCRPEGKHAFASIGFPGMLGCLSGMNDAGLAVATLEVYSAADGSASFSLLGTPYAMCYRRILEECTTIDEAEKLLRSLRRTTHMNLAVCDRQRGAVLEMTPKSVVRREAEAGFCPCTNHFRSAELATATACHRYDALNEAGRLPKLGLREVAARMHAANQGPDTFQTMIFEPAALKLHLAIGSCPSSALPLIELNLQPLLSAED
jgi:hypothetical protein